MSNDLQVMAPEPILVSVSGEVIEIKQIRVGQISKAMRIAHPFYENLKAAKDAAKKSDDPGVYGFDIYTLVMENTDAIIDMVALLCGKDRGWVEDLSLDDLIAVFSAIVEVNLDFFIQRLLPLLSGLAVGVGKATQNKTLVGQGLSNP
jgi:hypothetical protein